MSLTDRYQLVSPMGNGLKRRFGQNYVGVSKSNGEKVVIKCVNKVTDNHVVVERLRNESEFTFDRPGLPKIFELFETENELFLIKKYVEGITLNEHIDALKNRQKLKAVQLLLSKVNEQLMHLKEDGIVHCDIKPSNILINPLTNETAIIDFGLAIKIGSHKSRKMLFPLGYAAPELLLNHLDIVDHRTDIFSLATSIWRLIDGKLPLAHANPSVFTNLQLTHPLPKSNNISKKLFEILSKGAHKHSFLLPPNQMNSGEVKEKLKAAMNCRYQLSSDMIQEIVALKERSHWFTT